MVFFSLPGAIKVVVSSHFLRGLSTFVSRFSPILQALMLAFFYFVHMQNFSKPHLDCCLASTIVERLCLIYIIILEILKRDSIRVLALMKYDSLIPCSASNLLIIWLHMKLHPLPNPSIIATLVHSFHRCLEIQINLSNYKEF